MAGTRSEKIDLFKQHRSEYVKAKDPMAIQIGEAQYLSVAGVGGPGGGTLEEGSPFEEMIGALYGMAYTVKFASKFAGRDFAVGKLEALYGCDGQLADLESLPREEWRWRMMIRVPDFITGRDLDAAREALQAKGKPGDFGAVELETIDEGRCVQVLHVGAYEDTPKTARRIEDFCARQGLKPHRWQHQIYLNDPRRMAPERLQTILRQPVES